LLETVILPILRQIAGQTTTATVALNPNPERVQLAATELIKAVIGEADNGATA